MAMTVTTAMRLLRQAPRQLRYVGGSASVLACAVQPAVTVSTSVVAPFMAPGPFAVRTKISDRAARRKNLRKLKNSAEKLPLLKDTLRKLYLRTHPDLFGQYPEQQQTNGASYKELMGILDSIEKNNEFPPAKVQVLPFYLKTPVEGAFKEVKLHLRTTGGVCNTLVEEALGKFFADCGLPAAFQWGQGSWGKAVGKQHVQNSNLDFEDEDEIERKRQEELEAKKAKEEAEKNTAPAYNPVDRRAPEDNSIETVLNELNDVFELIAAVPWMDEEEYGELRVYYEKGNGLDEIDDRGYSIKESTKKIWAGERDMNVLGAGLDADSALIVQRILMHTYAIEQKIEKILANGGMQEEEEDEEEKETKSQ